MESCCIAERAQPGLCDDLVGWGFCRRETEEGDDRLMHRADATL